MADPGPRTSIPAAEAARLLGVSEAEIGDLVDETGAVSLETLRARAGSAAIALELARAREEAGRLSGQLKEVRSQNARLQKELKESVSERRRLTGEVLELRAAAEERLMLMERIEQMARVERDLSEARAEIEGLQNRGLLARLLGR